MDERIPSPTKDFVPYSGSKRPQPPVEQDSIDLSAIDVMSNAELVALAKRLAAQCGLVALMTPEQTAQAMLDVLAETALRPLSGGINIRADIDNRMKAIDKWLDRTQGKAIQRIDQRVQTVNAPAGELSSAELLLALRDLSAGGLLPAGVALLEDGTLDVDYEVMTHASGT